MQTKKLYIATFGCQMNVNDSERIVTMLRELGYETTTHLREGDLILFNTCTVRAGAEECLLQNIANLKNLKRDQGKIEQRMLELQTKKHALEARLSTQTPPLSPQEIGELGQELQTVDASLADYEEQWLLVSEQIEAES